MELEIFLSIISGIVIYWVIGKIKLTNKYFKFLRLCENNPFNVIFTENEIYVVTGNIEIIATDKSSKNDDNKMLTIKATSELRSIYMKNCVGFKANINLCEIMNFYRDGATFII